MSKKVTKKNNKFTPQFRRKVVLEIEDGNNGLIHRTKRKKVPPVPPFGLFV